MKQFNTFFREGKYKEAEACAAAAHEMAPHDTAAAAAVRMAQTQAGRVAPQPLPLSGVCVPPCCPCPEPAIARCAAAEPVPTPCPAEKLPRPGPSEKEKKVAKLLKKYQDACSEGHLARAKKLAGKALAIDPACFSTKIGSR
jgi:hypothetical protein